MAITGISSYDGKQIIAAGAQSAISAGIASNVEYKDGHGTLITTYPGDGQYYSGGFIVGSTVGDKGISISPNAVGFYNSTGDAAQITSGKVTAWDSLSSTKQDKLTFNYNGNSQITGINSSAIAGGGGSVPEGTMVESGLEYNSQNKVTGYSGSAFATIDSECQFFTHDDTLCHLSNSAQYALGVNLSGISGDLARMLGVDETVLFEGSGATGAFSEPLSAFKKVEFHLSDDTIIRQVATLYPDEAVNGNYIVGAASVWQPGLSPVRVLSVSGNMNNFSRSGASYQWWAKNDGGFSNFSTTPVKVIGIGRKQ